MTTSSELEIELLVDWTDPSRGLSGSAISIGMHVAVGTCLIFGLNHTPSFRSVPHTRTETRYLDVRNTRPKLIYGSAHAEAALGSANNRSGPVSYDAPTPIQQPLALRGTQTLIQPDAPKSVLLPELTPIPFVAVWAAKLPTLSPKISTPVQQVAVPNQHPKIATPNQEVTASDINLASTPFKSPVPMPQATTQTPVAAPENKTPPVSALAVSSAAGSAEPARVISLSDLHLKNGTVTIPLANTSVMPSTTDAMTMARSNKDAKGGQANTPGPSNPEARSGPATERAGTPGGSPNPSAHSGAGDSKGGNSGASGSKAVGPGAGGSKAGGAAVGESGDGDSGASDNARIRYPKDGQFGVVIVGNNLANEYPEAAELWNGRMIYTVYVHVGSGKSWILQYAPVRNLASDKVAGVTKPDAPWPYELVRPALTWADGDSETVMMHGFVTDAGRLERLELLLPTGFPQEQIIQHALKLWQFRPAQQNGEAISVEVLLIIPSQQAP